jgi:DNA-binding CsgD family transcriptional regulator
MDPNPAHQFLSFFKSYTDTLKSCNCICGNKSFETLDQFLLLPRQALYLFDWRSNTLPYKRGIKRLFGYNDDEFTTETLGQYVHPEDAERYTKLVKLTNEWARKLKPEPFSIEVLVDYRVRHANGSYLKVLRQSTIFEQCRNATPRSALNLITHISGIKTDNSVNLSITSLETGEVILEDRDKTAAGFMFSNRELDILKLLKQGKNSESIADELFISRHTVDTHRRNMLKKTGCKNTMELVHQASILRII